MSTTGGIMFDMLPLNGKKKKKRGNGELPEQQSSHFNLSDIPKQMDVYWRPFSEFLPEGVDYDELSEEEKKIAKNRYRFAFLRPGKYQSITGIGGKNGSMYP